MEPPKPPKVPNDGPGPRGGADCYYTSRVLNSTARHVRFVKKLRIEEEDYRKGQESNARVRKDHMNNDFFLHCDRKSRINTVAHRVELCMRAQEQDLEKRKQKLISLYTLEEERNVKKFVEQVQAGVEAVWQDKQDRLKYLLDKRQKESDARTSFIPVSKCVHAYNCMMQAATKEMQQIHLYQMHEKQARQMAEKELDKMWHEVAMKESDTLAARMEKDALDSYRRNMECLDYSNRIVEQRNRHQAMEREKLKAEQLAMKLQFEEDTRKEKEAEARAKQKQLDATMESNLAREEHKRKMEKAKQEEKMIQDTWVALNKGSLDDNAAAVQRRRRIEHDTNICNAKLVQLRENMRHCDEADEELRKVELKRQEAIFDRERCQLQKKAQIASKERREAMMQQILGRMEKSEVQKKLEDEQEYERQIFEQSQRLIDQKAARDLQQRKDHQRDLLDQIAYNQQLKERARQEELDQIRKGELARQEYDNEIRNMMLRPSVTEQVHPFMRQMAAGLKMRKKCPCSRPDYCAEEPVIEKSQPPAPTN